MVKLEKIEKNIVALEIEVSSEKYAVALGQAFKKVAKSVNIPGFRKGHAPKSLLENHVGKEYIKEEALDILLPEAYTEAIAETKIEPINRPKVDIVEAEEGKPVVFRITVEVKPEVELGEYIGIEVTKEKSEISDDAIDAELQKLRERHAKLINVDGPAELKDTTIIDFEGFVNDVAFPGGAGTDYSLELGSGSFIPGFEEQLVGSMVGEARDVTVTFPEEYHAEDLAGKPAVFKVTVKEIKRKEFLELDDEFAKDVSEFETLQELKDDILNRLKEAAQKQADYRLKDVLVEKVTDASTVEVPEILVEEKIEVMVQNFTQRLSMQGMNIEDYLKYSETDLESLKADYKPAAEKAVKTDLVLEAIAVKENVEASEEEMEDHIAKLASQYKVEPPVVKEWIVSGGNLEALKKSLAIEKVVDLIQDKAVIS